MHRVSRLSLFLHDLAALYAEPKTALEPIGYTFKRYLTAADEVEAHAAAKAYWQRRIADLPGAPSLPLAVRSGEVVESGMTRRHFFMAADELGRLTQRCREHALTLPVVLLAAFAEVIGAASDQPRFLLNLPVFARKQLHPDVGRVVGDFTNILLLAVDLSEVLPFQERARRLHSQLIEAAAHQEYSGVDVLREIAATRPGEWLAAPIVFTSAIGLGDLFTPRVRRCFGRPAWSISQTPQVWLDHQVTDLDDGLLFNWDIVDGIFASGVVDAMWEAYSTSVRWLYGASKTWTDAAPAKLPARQEAARGPPSTRHPARFPTTSCTSRFFRARATRLTASRLQGTALGSGPTANLRITPWRLPVSYVSRACRQATSSRSRWIAGPIRSPRFSALSPRARRSFLSAVSIRLSVVPKSIGIARRTTVLTRHFDRKSIEWSPELRVVEVESAGVARRLDQPVAISPES